jgi:hypothetical protein
MSAVALRSFGNCELGRSCFVQSHRALKSADRQLALSKSKFTIRDLIYLYIFVPMYIRACLDLNPRPALWQPEEWPGSGRRPFLAVAEDRMEDTEEADVDAIFQDALVSVFGDVAEAHGQCGKHFMYRSDHRYPVVFTALFPSFLCRKLPS